MTTTPHMTGGEKMKVAALADMATIAALKGVLIGYAELEAMYNAAVASVQPRIDDLVSQRNAYSDENNKLKSIIDNYRNGEKHTAARLRECEALCKADRAEITRLQGLLNKLQLGGEPTRKQHRSNLEAERNALAEALEKEEFAHNDSIARATAAEQERDALRA